MERDNTQNSYPLSLDEEALFLFLFTLFFSCLVYLALEQEKPVVEYDYFFFLNPKILSLQLCPLFCLVLFVRLEAVTMVVNSGFFFLVVVCMHTEKARMENMGMLTVV